MKTATDGNSGFRLAELLERARARGRGSEASEQPQQQENEEKTSDEKQGGPEFMSLRYNVREQRRKIRRDLKPLENYLLDDIAEGTINSWDSQNEFDLKILALGLGIKVNRIYSMLKDLSERSIIVRKPTRYPGREILGLNPAFFGQILTNHQHELEKKRHLTLVWDNLSSDVDNFKVQVPNGTN